MDIWARTFYQQYMPYISKKRYWACIAIALVSAGLLIISDRGFAGSQYPVPKIKPVISTNIPVPTLKPSAAPQIEDRGILNKRDRKLYTEIFDLQDSGHIQDAKAKIQNLKNGNLMGHVLAQRYLHPTAYKAEFHELAAWLEKYADHPQATRIYTLAQKKKPGGTHAKLDKPRNNIKLGRMVHADTKGRTYKSVKKRSKDQNKDVRKLKSRIRHHIDTYEPTQALNLLTTHAAGKLLDNVEFDQMRAQIAAGYLYAQKYDSSQKYASAALKRSGKYVPHAAWVSGLVQWSKGRYKNAAIMFERAATSAYASSWMKSAAAYWASRSHMRAKNVKEVSRWLKKSASYNQTFYGLIATRALGNDLDFNWSMPRLTSRLRRSIEDEAAGQRTKSLISIGQVKLAEQELKMLIGKDIESQDILAYANHYKLPALTMRLGRSISDKKGNPYFGALYPAMAWELEDNQHIDKALIHAFIRQESKFDPNAKSTSGARGLMQIMPRTASFVAKDPSLKTMQGREKLADPIFNINLGQSYIVGLLDQNIVDQNLLFLALAYNAGPGNLQKWKRERKNIDDPLLFIETIPFGETRAFVERVMANYWIYRSRFKQDTPSLDALAEGRWPDYVPMDRNSLRFASR